MSLPLNIFPGFSSYGVVSEQVKEIATVFNAEGVDALQSIGEKQVAWADVGVRVSKGDFRVKIPVRLTSLMGFEPFDGTRRYHPVTVASVAVNVTPWSLGLEWPVQISTNGIAQLQDFYGISGVANDVVQHARAQKADMVASVIMSGFTNTALGVTAKALTLPQPGFPGGLPLFVDATQTKHFANPLDANSARFANLFLGAGKINDSGVMERVLTGMTQVPHPSKANMTLGNEVTDIIGGTNMLGPFWKLAIQTLSLETTTSPGNLAAATTNPYSAENMAKATQMLGMSGLTPWRFWIAPQLDAHPYLQANPTKQMWITISRTRRGASWCELAGPNTEFAPIVTLLGDGTEEARKTRKVRLFGDLDGGAAAGLPHFIAKYFETTPV
ncbi:MAG TPA: hypothetical protein VK550_12260 [Polyangiaceae bacterium]|nr:hypothetical protein [Polyangiaceae bacterium]